MIASLPGFMPAGHVDAIFSAPSGHVEVQLRKLAAPRLLWLNTRVMRDDPGFSEAGGTAEAYGRWLMERCAYAVTAEPWDDRTDILGVADRYGGAGIGHNGGSGRAAFIHGYHVKGIGRTRLVSILTDMLHGSGGAYLEECVRETIFAEIASAEFPSGAVPVLAIIETGQVQVWDTDNGPKAERRCLLVRPGFLRPAHFERAPGFISDDPLEGAADTARVRNTFLAAAAACGVDELRAAYRAFWVRWAEQLAYAFVHRLPHGGNTASNIALDGRLLDFGAMAAMPSWARVSTMMGGAPVGMDMNFLVQALQTQCQSWAQHLDTDLGSQEEITRTMAEVSTTYRECLWREVLSVLGLSRTESQLLLKGDSDGKLRAAINRLLGHFQREQFTIFDDTPQPRIVWDVDGIWSTPVLPHLQELRCLLEDGLGPLDTLALRLLAARCRLRGTTRTRLFRETTKREVYDAVEAAHPGSSLTPRILDDFISRYVVENRRHDRIEPSQAVAVGFARNNESAFVLFRCLRDDRYFAVVEWRTGALPDNTRLYLVHIDQDRLIFAGDTVPDFIGAVFLSDQTEAIAPC